MIHVVIVDDHGVVRAGIRALLAEDPSITVVAEASSADEALSLLSRADVPMDVMVLDLSIKGANGVEVLRRARAQRPKLAVLVHTMYAAAQYEERLRAEGAAGFLCKDRSEEGLLDAVRAVARGEGYFRGEAAVGERPGVGLEALTSRELQVFMMLAEGRSVGEVARELGVGMSTVSTHIGRTREKLGVQSVAELIAYAHRHGLAG